METFPISVAFISMCVSTLALLVSYAALVHDYKYSSDRHTFYLTSTIALNKITDVSNVFMNTGSYDLLSSYPTVQNVYFTDGPNSSDPNLLQKLMDISGCSIPLVRPGFSPMNRTNHCQCITDTYTNFVNKTAGSWTNVSLLDRQTSSDAVKKCLMYRPIWNTSHCGSLCELHPLELVYYCHVVVILCCVNYLLSLVQEELCTMKVRKVVLLMVTVLFVSLLSFLSPIRTIFSVISIVVVMILLITGFDDLGPFHGPEYKRLPDNSDGSQQPGPGDAQNQGGGPGDAQYPGDGPGGEQPGQGPDAYGQTPGPPAEYQLVYHPVPVYGQTAAVYVPSQPAAPYACGYYTYAYQYRPMQTYAGGRVQNLGFSWDQYGIQFSKRDGVTDVGPHTLTLALWTNLKILLSVYCIYIAVHGFGRDYVNVVCFGVIGMILGLSLQNHLFEEWHFFKNKFYKFFKQTVCTVISFVCMINLALLTAAYVDVDSPYSRSVAISVVIELFIFSLVLLEWWFPLANATYEFGWTDMIVFILVVFLNVLLTVVSTVNTLTS